MVAFSFARKMRKRTGLAENGVSGGPVSLRARPKGCIIEPSLLALGFTFDSYA